MLSHLPDRGTEKKKQRIEEEKESLNPAATARATGPQSIHYHTSWGNPQPTTPSILLLLLSNS